MPKSGTGGFGKSAETTVNSRMENYLLRLCTLLEQIDG
jgi:hypothetical protein